MTQLIMLIGISGSGKSTVAKSYEDKGYLVFSSDAIRAELLGDENDQTQNGRVFDELHKRIKNALREHKDCVYDATNLSAKRRTAFLNSLKNERIATWNEAVLVLAPIGECIRRANARERKVPSHVIWRQAKQFQTPILGEGFHSFDVVFTYDGFARTPADYISKNEKMKHDNPHHTLSIAQHMIRCCEECLSHERIDQVDVLAASYHDIGKFYTKEFSYSKKYEKEVARYSCHESLGAYLFLVGMLGGWKKIAESMGADRVIEAAALITYHMEHYKRTPESMEKFNMMLGQKMAHRLAFLNENDRAAH